VPFFEKKFMSTSEGGSVGSVKFPYATTKVFELFNTWLYTGSLWEIPPDGKFKVPPEIKQTTLTDLWIFARMLRMIGLKNAALYALAEVVNTREPVAIGNLKRIWLRTGPYEGLRQLVIDQCLWNDLEAGQLFDDKYNKYYTVEICLSIMRDMHSKLRLARGVANPLLNMNNYLDEMPQENEKEGEVKAECGFM
jgi:hypothetical protein